MTFAVTTFSVNPQSRVPKACERCRRLHKKCVYSNSGSISCVLCTKNNHDCDVFEAEVSGSKKRKLIEDSHTSDAPIHHHSIFKNDKIYANVIRSGELKSQFITSSQPLAPLLSRDSFLTLSDGDFCNLFFPWREMFLPARDKYNKEQEIDEDLLHYLKKKRAFDVPSQKTQKKLVQLFLDNIYPIYPVVDRDIVNHLEEVPPILLNALMLSGVRYDKEEPNVRVRAESFRQKCKFLELAETNKITLIQTFLLLSAHEESPEGAQISREYLSRAANLIEELGLHNFGAKNELVSFESHFPSSEEGATSIAYRLSYKISLLTRLFWTSYCSDRVTSITGCCSMFFNALDLAIDEPKVEDFDGNFRDFEIFRRWYRNCDLMERILVVLYRPPGNRSIDYNLERDILATFNGQLDSKIEELIGSKFSKFLTICSSLCAVLYLRSNLDFFSLLEDQYELGSGLVDSNSPLADNKMFYLSKFSETIVENAEDPKIEHVVIIQAVLHVVVLLHLEIEARKRLEVDDSREPLDLLGPKKEMFRQCLSFLKDNSSKWFYSAASYHLSKELLRKSTRHQDEAKLSSQDVFSMFFNYST